MTRCRALTSHSVSSILAAITITACAGEQRAADPLSPTPSTVPLPSELTVGYYSALATYVDLTSLQVVVGEGASAWRLTGRDLLPSPDNGPWQYSVPRTVPTTGRLPARVALIVPSGDTLAAASVSVRLAPDHRFGIGVYIPRVFPRGPADRCLGEVTPVAIRGSERSGVADSMFVIVGGLPKGAIC
jgi:hypothetical protein